MDIIRIEGTTRTIGAAQGYIGLPLRDITVDDSVTGPDSPAMETAWLFSEDELAAVNAGQPVILRLMGRQHPPVMLYVGSEARGVLTDAARDVLFERARQIDVEGFVEDHDDRHATGNLARAGAAYAYFGSFDDATRANDHPGSFIRFLVHELWPNSWAGWWKPKSRRADLVRAAALLIAEIERLDRVELRKVT